MSAYQHVYVEGTDDIETLEKIFPTMKGVLLDGKGKEKVMGKVRRDEDACGLVDRDFDSEEEVVKSHGPDSRVRILPRYCLENYLVEPKYLLEFADQTNITAHEPWESEESIEKLIIAKGQELCYYTAANEILSNMSKQMSYRQLHRHFAEFPIIAQNEVRERLNDRFSRLPARDELDELVTRWEVRSEEIKTECQTLEGVQRLINGKILLRKVIFAEFKKVDESRFGGYEDEDFVEELAVIAEGSPPADLISIFRDFGIRVVE